MSSTECTDSNTAQNPDPNYWSHTHKCTLHTGESNCVNQAATISAALPAPPSPGAAFALKHKRVEPISVPVQSGESDAGTNLTKKKKCKSIFQKTCRAIFKLYHFHNPAWAAPLPIPAVKQQRGQRPAVRSGSPACTAGPWDPGAPEKLQPAQDRGFMAPLIPRCVLLLLPSTDPGSHCMVCAFNRLKWLNTSSFLSLLHQCLLI